MTLCPFLLPASVLDTHLLEVRTRRQVILAGSSSVKLARNPQNVEPEPTVAGNLIQFLSRNRCIHANRIQTPTHNPRKRTLKTNFFETQCVGLAYMRSA